MLSNNHDDDYIGFKLRARYTLPRLGGYKKMCHQRGGLRPHQQEKTPTTSIQLHHSLDLDLDRAPPTSCVCTHEYLLRIPGRWCGRWPYRILRTWCGPWLYRIRILKTSSRTSLRMNARACTPRAEFSDLEKYGAAFAKVPKLEVMRSPIHTETTYYVTPPLPLHQPDLIPVPDTYQTGPVAE